MVERGPEAAAAQASGRENVDVLLRLDSAAAVTRGDPPPPIYPTTTNF